MRSSLIVIPTLLLVLGCGLLGGKSPVAKEQLDADIAKQTVNVDGGEWMFAVDDIRCFEVVDKDVKTTDTTAEIPVMIGSFWEMTLTSGKQIYPTVLGRMVMHYKKNGDKWEFERADPSLLMKRHMDIDDFRQFAPMQAQLCRYHRFEKKK